MKRVTLASIAAFSLLASGLALAGTRVIVTKAGCGSEFKDNKSMRKSCESCVDGGDKFKKQTDDSWECK
ncbi:MAG: hypothetical protein AAFQ65_06960 [Myxococcota bacterium]